MATERPIVYFVDDEVDFITTCQLVFAVLYEEKYEVHCAQNMEEAVELAKEQDRLTVIFIDLNFEDGLTGADILEEMKKHMRFPYRAIFVSGEDRAEGKVKALAAGGMAYEVKPITTEVIEAYIEVALREIENELRSVEMARRATHDDLTGLLNRAGFNEHALQVLHEAVRHKTPTACIYIDGDRFKVVNDTYGHEFGNTVIQGMAWCIRDHAHKIRRTDIVARLYGDEFVILMAAANEEQARPHALEIEQAISQLEFIAPTGVKVQVSASAGVASIPAGESDLDKLLKLSEDAMYARKGEGH